MRGADRIQDLRMIRRFGLDKLRQIVSAEKNKKD